MDRKSASKDRIGVGELLTKYLVMAAWVFAFYQLFGLYVAIKSSGG